MRRISIPDARKAFADEIKKAVGFTPMAKEIDVKAISGDKVILQINDKHYSFSYTTGIHVSEMTEITEDISKAMVEKLTADEPLVTVDETTINPAKVGDLQKQTNASVTQAKHEAEKK